MSAAGPEAAPARFPSRAFGNPLATPRAPVGLSSPPMFVRPDTPVEPAALQLPHRRIIAACWTATLALIGMSLFVNWQRYRGGHGSLLGFVDFFDVDHEQSLPTFFSVCVLLGAAVVVACIAALKRRRADRFAPHWRWLSLGFFGLALDEITGLHEKLTPFTHWLLRGYPLAPRSWTLVGMVVAGTVAALFLRFLHHLPYPVRRVVVAAGAIYLGGAIGMEIIGGAHVRVHGLDFGYAVYSVIEEGMEMGGAVLFLDAMLVYYAALGQTVQFAVAPRPGASVIAAAVPVAPAESLVAPLLARVSAPSSGRRSSSRARRPSR